MKESKVYSSAARAARISAGMCALAMLLSINAGPANAGEIIPSLGITKSTDDNAGDAKFSGGLAFRGAIVPFLKAEVGVSYREQSYFGDDLTIQQWPITGSLWLTPFPVFYAGGGVGYYQTTYKYSGLLPFDSSTDQKFGVHLGGGLDVPIAPRLGLDISGRYIFMEQKQSELPPNEFNPDFWTTSVGLAIKF